MNDQKMEFFIRNGEEMGIEGIPHAKFVKMKCKQNYLKLKFVKYMKIYMMNFLKKNEFFE